MDKNDKQRKRKWTTFIRKSADFQKNGQDLVRKSAGFQENGPNLVRKGPKLQRKKTLRQQILNFVCFFFQFLTLFFVNIES